MLNQVFFCVGAAKTGTTILARLLDQQPGVACMWEGYLLKPRHGSSVLNPESNAWGKHGFTRGAVEDWHRRALSTREGPRGDVEAIRTSEAVRTIFSEVFEEFGAASGADVVGDKWPYYWKSMPLMVEAFPDAKFVYNVRDPRAVWNSGETFKRRQVGDAVLQEMLESERSVRQHLDPERLVTIRYEDLITSAAATMTELADFIGFDFDADALAYDPAADPLPNRWNWVPEAKGDLDPELTEKWRHQMPVDQQRRVTAECADFLERYGYAE